MPVFISPEGNPESWEEKPVGYIDPSEPTLQELLSKIDQETLEATNAGFEFAIQGQTLHFAYGPESQQDFTIATATATLKLMGTPGLPDGVEWNGWAIARDENGAEVSRELVVLNLSVNEFLTLSLQGALVHRSTQMEIGRRKKEALFVA